ncbi:MAG: RsiV family protein, partial [Luteimonas sp.]
GKMIDEGSEASAKNFAQFEPIAGPAGKLKGLRFVFPPYQVGPYADGTQTVDVPAEILLPHVAPEYRNLFVGG